tara:strand:+ start:579 stop:1241 length:663 start_codon:yes stop_codon:yes gene_type:complete
MGFKYKKFEVRTGEVVEPTRIRQNMQALAHEINGNLDRENLPEKCIDSEVIAYETFNDIETQASSVHFDMKDKGVQFIEVMSLTLDVPVDCVVIAHFGCYFTWHVDDSTVLDADISGTPKANANWGNFYFDMHHYDEVQEHFADFRLRIQGEDVCKTFSYPFMRQAQSTYMTGALQTVAGQIKVSVEAKIFRNNLGKIEESEAFYYTIRERNLVVQAKKR